MKITVEMVVFARCEIAQHDLCNGVGVQTGPSGTVRTVKVCTCICHDTTVRDTRMKLSDYTAEPTQIKLPLTGTTF